MPVVFTISVFCLQDVRQKKMVMTTIKIRLFINVYLWNLSVVFFVPAFVLFVVYSCFLPLMGHKGWHKGII